MMMPDFETGVRAGFRELRNQGVTVLESKDRLDGLFGS